MMKSNLISPMLKKSRLSHRFTIITVLFLSVLLGLLAYTIMTLQEDKSNAILIDMAGRQRMLLQKHINEVFLTSQGVPADYVSTRHLMNSTLNALIEGGSVVLNFETNQSQTIPAAPTKEISEKLREQRTHIEHISQLADNFLSLSPDPLNFQKQLKTLRAQNSLAIRTADEAVKQLDEYSEATITTMVRWEVFIALFVGLLGMFAASKGIRDGHKLEKEVEERKRAEEALRESEFFLNTIVENIPNMIFVKAAEDLRFVRINKAGEKLLNFSRKDILGKTDFDLFPEEQAKYFVTKDREVLTGKQLVDIIEEPLQTPSEGLRFLHTKKIPLFDDQGIPQYLLGISDDITERKQTEARLRESEMKETKAIRQSDELKSALLASVSHELRTPLTAMKTTVSNIIGDGTRDMNEVQQGFLNGIDQEINYMSRLVDNLLDMSQIEAGTLIPHREWHPLEDLVEGALRRTEQSLGTRDIQISIPEDIRPVFVDAVEIQQVLINLLDNAVKYSPSDSPIQLRVRVGPQQILVEVSNMGEPMQAQELKRIFERFYRRRSPRNEPIRGTGLGLAICKGIVEAHGGQTWAESNGREVTITFTIPVKESMESFSLEGQHKV